MHTQEVEREARHSDPIPLPRKRRSTETSNITRVILKCLKEPSAYTETLKQLHESSKKYYDHIIHHLEQNWQKERETYSTFYETVCELNEEDFRVNPATIRTKKKGRRSG